MLLANAASVALASHSAAVRMCASVICVSTTLCQADRAGMHFKTHAHHSALAGQDACATLACHALLNTLCWGGSGCSAPE